MCNDCTDLLAALRNLVTRCDGEDGVRADGSNIPTAQAHAVLARYDSADDDDACPNCDAGVTCDCSYCENRAVTAEEDRIEAGQARWSETGSTRR